MAALRIAFLIEEFKIGSPARALLDRFLLGYPRAGAFHLPPAGRKIAVHASGAEGRAELERRQRDHGLDIAADPAAAVAGAGGVVVVPAGGGDRPLDGLAELLGKLEEGARVFIHGLPAATAELSAQLGERAASRRIELLAGSWPSVTWRLPRVEIPTSSAVSEALVVTLGARGEAELLAVDALLPLVEGRRGRRAGPQEGTGGAAVALQGESLWKAFEPASPARGLLAAALSRSDRPQGNALKDGRTEDLLGLGPGPGLLPELAREPVLYRLEHEAIPPSLVCVLNGVVGDLNFAARLETGGTVSAQIFKAWPPNDHHWSRLAEVVERYLDGGARPWPFARSILAAALLDASRRALESPGTKLGIQGPGNYSPPQTILFSKE